MPGQEILIVLENPRERIEFVQCLENLGYRVSVAASGIEAGDLVSANQFSMIVADDATPALNPGRFLETVLKKDETSRVIFISEHPSVENAIDLMKAGAADFLIKPVAKEQLELSARRIFSPARGNSVSPVRPSSGLRSLEIITDDRHMQRILALAAKVADSSAAVLIQGESGTGKELFARFIHEKSRRRDKPFIAVNCAALPEALLESELFGHEKGAFTGAVSRKLGKFELANTGTLFLDEITEMQFHLQAKLLRVLQEKVLDRVGGIDPVEVDVRVIATTNRDVKAAMEEKKFREDLYYRLSTIPLIIPPLRERRGDIRSLSEHFIRKYSQIDARSVKGLTPEALNVLFRHPFQGNVRELENLIHRAVLLAETQMIEPEDLFPEGVGEATSEAPDPSFAYPVEPAPLKEMEEKMIFHALDRTDGNRTHAAKILGISVRTLRNKLNEYKKAGSTVDDGM